MDLEVVLKRFESPDEVRTMPKGRFEIVRLGGVTIGRATYEPGWRWSTHVGPQVGATLCTVEHVGLVLSGTATAAFDDGRVFELREGQLFCIPAVPHDSCVVGEQPATGSDPADFVVRWATGIRLITARVSSAAPVAPRSRGRHA